VSISLILLGSLLIRAFLVFFFGSVVNYDIESYRLIGKLTFLGQNIYPFPARAHYPYIPAYLYLQNLAYFIENKWGFSQIITLKIINVIADLIIVYFVYLLSRKNRKKTIFYAFNPISLLIITLHGQFDSLTVLFLLNSLYFIKNKLLVWLSYSLSVSVKIWPLLFFFIFLKKRKLIFQIITFCFLPVFLIFTYTVFFRSSPVDIIATVLKYQGVQNIWGLGKVFLYFNIPLTIQKIFNYFLIFYIFFISIIKKDKNMIKQIFDLLIIFFVLTLGFSIQYYYWLMPFLFLLLPKRWLILYTALLIQLISYYIPWVFVLTPSINGIFKTLQNFTDWYAWVSFVFFWYISNKKCLSDNP